MKIKLYISCLFISIYSNMQIYEFFTELFPLDPIPTELNVYLNIKSSPLKSSINYLVIPWAVLINKNKLNMIPKIKLKGGFTVCQHIYYKKILPILKEIGIDTLFTPHAAYSYNHENIKILPIPIYAVNYLPPLPKKDIFYSFIGATSTHPIREVIMNFNNKNNLFLKKRNFWHFGRDTFRPNCNTKEEQKQEKEEYMEILSRSRFSLCPRGTGPNSIRFWESLGAGAIPILISDDLILPQNFKLWDQCIIRIKENKFNQQKLERVLSKINFEQENSMRKLCLNAFKLFSGKNLSSAIRFHYNNIIKS